MELFRDDNTRGYTDDELKSLNDEWETLSAGIEEFTDEWNDLAQEFCDEVSRR